MIALAAVGDRESFLAAEIAGAPPGVDEDELRRRCHQTLTSEAHRQRFCGIPNV